MSGLEGADRLRGVLRRAGPNAMHALASAMYVDANRIMAQAVRLAPREFGTLRASGHVETPIVSENHVIVDMGFGGAAQAYAIVQHEREDYQHPRGGQAHYLSQPFAEAAPGFLDRLANRISRSMFVR